MRLRARMRVFPRRFRHLPAWLSNTAELFHRPGSPGRCRQSRTHKLVGRTDEAEGGEWQSRVQAGASWGKENEDLEEAAGPISPTCARFPGSTEAALPPSGACLTGQVCALEGDGEGRSNPLSGPLAARWHCHDSGSSPREPSL